LLLIQQPPVMVHLLASVGEQLPAKGVGVGDGDGLHCGEKGVIFGSLSSQSRPPQLVEYHWSLSLSQ
jgi:hypothetical protein